MTTRSHSATRVLDEAGPTVSMRQAAHVLGCSPGTAYALHERGDLASMGVRVLRLGRCLRVSTADLRRAVGLDDGGGTTA